MIAQEELGVRRSIVEDSAETLLLKVLLFAAGFATSVLISRGLGPDGRGQYYLPIIAVGTMVTFCKLGLDQANVFLLGTRRISFIRLSAQNGLIALVMGSLGVFGLLVAPWVLPAVFSGTPWAYLIFAGATIPFALHAQFSAGLLALRGWVTWQFRAALVASSAQVTVLLVLLSVRQLAVGPALAAYLVAGLLTWILIVPALNRAKMLWVRWDAGLLRDTLRHSLTLHLGMVLFFLHLRLDMFMVKVMVGTTALGLYSLSVVLAETVLLPTDSLAVALLPRQVGNSLQEAALAALRGARTNGVLAASLTVLWGSLGMAVISLFFGSEFAPAYLPLVALLPGMIFMGMQRVCGAPILRAGKPSRITAIYALSLLGNVTLNLWWIPRWGAFGAGLASSVSYGFGALLFLVWTARLAGVSLLEGVIPRRADWLLLRQAALRGTERLQSMLAGR